MREGTRWFPIADAGHFGERSRATSCPAGWKAMRSAKVSLLIVQVPVQTERLNPRGTNPARKSTFIVRPVPSCVCRVYAYASYFLLHVSVSTHGRSYSVTATRSRIRMRDRKLLPPSYIPTGDCSALSLLPSLFLSCALEGPKRDAQQK